MADDTRFPFTNRRIADVLNSTGRPLWLYDTRLPGFAVTVSPLQKKAFYFTGRVKGRPTRQKIGGFPALSVDEARAACRTIVGDVAAGRATQERRRAGRATLDDLFGHYLEVHAKPRKRTWKDDEREYERFIRPEFGRYTLAMIARGDVAKLVATIERENGIGPAAKVRALLSKMFTIAIRDEWTDKANPVFGTDRPTYEPRQRYIKADELAAFFNAIDTLRYEVTRDFFRLALYTGARRSNIAAMRWDELDLSTAVWTIPARKTKGKKPLTVPLIPAAKEIILRRQERSPDNCPWVLPGRSREGHYNEPKTAMAKIRERSGIADLRLHDLRRTLGAWQQAGGASLRTIQQTLGHSSVEVTARVYSPVDSEQVRESMTQTVKRMLEGKG